MTQELELPFKGMCALCGEVIPAGAVGRYVRNIGVTHPACEIVPQANQQVEITDKGTWRVMALAKEADGDTIAILASDNDVTVGTRLVMVKGADYWWSNDEPYRFDGSTFTRV